MNKFKIGDRIIVVGESKYINKYKDMVGIITAIQDNNPIWGKIYSVDLNKEKEKKPVIDLKYCVFFEEEINLIDLLLEKERNEKKDEMFVKMIGVDPYGEENWL